MKLSPVEQQRFDNWSSLNCVKARHDRLYYEDGRPRLDNDNKPRQEYVKRIKAMSLDELTEQTKQKIWLSAYADNNPRSDYHWHVDCCYDELMERTQTDAIYSKCYDEAF